MKNQNTNDDQLLSAESSAFKPNNYHSLKNDKPENHTKQEESPAPVVLLKPDWLAYKLQCEKKIAINTRNIAQFRESTANISSRLKANYELKITQLEQKNTELRLMIEGFSSARKKEQTAFNTGQEANLDRFKAEFNGQMDKLV